MENINRKAKLLNILTEKLISENNSNHKFVAFDEASETEIKIQRIYKTKRKLGTRILCIVLDLPDTINNSKDLLLYFKKLRNSMTKKYANFPYWKELGTYSIILCDNTKYERFKNEIKHFRDFSGLHMNVMLGTFLVNHEKPEYVATKTWGLIFSGDKYGQINQALNNWMNY